MNVTEGAGRFQVFERGQIVFSEPQKMLMAAYQRKGRDAFALDWNITERFHYDFFIVRWDKDGTNIGQHDVQSSDPNASPTGGAWTAPSHGLGSYRIVIEG